MIELDWYGLLMRRVVTAGQNSLSGLKACFEHEESFRVEVVLGLIFFIIAPFIADNLIEWGLLVAALFIVLIVELLNSAVEATVDRIGVEYHDLAKRAKDIGSAAVLLGMLLFATIWGAVLYSRVIY